MLKKPLLQENPLKRWKKAKDVNRQGKKVILYDGKGDRKQRRRFEISLRKYAFRWFVEENTEYAQQELLEKAKKHYKRGFTKSEFFLYLIENHKDEIFELGEKESNYGSQLQTRVRGQNQRSAVLYK